MINQFRRFFIWLIRIEKSQQYLYVTICDGWLGAWVR